MSIEGCGVSSWHDKNILKVILVMVAQLYEYIKNHWIVHFIWVICKVCELYLNKGYQKNILIILCTEKKKEDTREHSL